jgi:hypothetical protein
MQLGVEFVSLYGGGSSDSLVGPAFSLAIGGALARRFVLYGEMVEHVGFSGLSGEDMALFGLGVAAGMNYFFANNMFVGGSLGFGGATYEAISNTNTTTTEDSSPMKNAFLAKAEIGHEWWVSYNWGLGASVQFVMTSATDNSTRSADPQMLEMFAIKVVFSATYN